MKIHQITLIVATLFVTGVHPAAIGPRVSLNDKELFDCRFSRLIPCSLTNSSGRCTRLRLINYEVLAMR
jgi:hypothetical protein